MRHLRAWLVTTLPGASGHCRLDYARPPFGGQYAQDERVQTTRAQGLGNGICPGVLSHSPRSKIAAVERREADVPRHGT